MQIDILRHAKSSWADPGQDDPERPLNPRGERAAAAVGRYLAERGELPDLVLCSAALRARQTWARVARRLPAEHRTELLVEPALYLASPAVWIERLRQVPEQVRRVLLVGHNPGLAQLAEALVKDDPQSRALRAMRRKYPTAGLATLKLRGPWAALERGRGALLRFLTPKDLA